MDEQTLAQELAQPEARELLKNTGLARLAYNGPDGLPRVVPTGFFWNGEEIVVCTAVTAPKVRALRERPDVALSIDTADTSGTARALSIRGRAAIEIVDGVPDEYLAGASNETDGDAAAEFERAVRATYPQMARISITPQWARFYDFGAGRLPKFLSDLVEKASM